MKDEFRVVVASGSFRSSIPADVHLPHQWSPEGVAVQTPFTGAHLLHLATAGCVLNDVYREATSMSVVIDGVRVEASGSFDTDVWRSRGITYRVDIDSPSSDADLARLLAVVDDIAEIPRVLRAGAEVERIE